MAALESQAIWDRLDRLQRDHESLRIEHTALAARAEHLTDLVETLTDMVKARAATADNQHAEIISSITTLTAAENERAGMAKLGRGVAIAVGAVAALAGIVIAALAGRSPHG